MAKLLLKDIVDCFDLEVLNTGTLMDSSVRVSDINRPGLVLAGYIQYFDEERIQLIGKTEIAFLESLEKRVADERWLTFINLNFRLRNLGYDAAEHFIEKQRQYCLTDHHD